MHGKVSYEGAGETPKATVVDVSPAKAQHTVKTIGVAGLINSLMAVRPSSSVPTVYGGGTEMISLGG
jgi:hypothetical protein